MSRVCTSSSSTRNVAHAVFLFKNFISSVARGRARREQVRHPHSSTQSVVKNALQYANYIMCQRRVEYTIIQYTHDIQLKWRFSPLPFPSLSSSTCSAYAALLSFYLRDIVYFLVLHFVWLRLSGSWMLKYFLHTICTHIYSEHTHNAIVDAATGCLADYCTMSVSVQNTE